jgi:pimeloyl-ACP methyl ester carboxylesterase
MRLLTNYISKSLTSSDGLIIYYEITVPQNSNGKKLFFIHGLGGDLTAWDEERISFRDLGYTTIALDLRGHGLSGRAKTEKGYSMKNFAQDVHEIITQEQLINVTVIGHCLGGMVALTLEALHTNSMEALILVDTTYKPAVTGRLLVDHKIINKFFLFLSKVAPNIGINTHENSLHFKGTDDVNIPRFLSDVIHTSLKSYFLIYKKLYSFDATALLQKIAVPTLIVEGTEDTVFPPEVAMQLHARIKNSQLEFINNANHILVLNKPEDLVMTINNFINRLG